MIDANELSKRMLATWLTEIDKLKALYPQLREEMAEIPNGAEVLQHAIDSLRPAHDAMIELAKSAPGELTAAIDDIKQRAQVVKERAEKARALAGKVRPPKPPDVDLGKPKMDLAPQLGRELLERVPPPEQPAVKPSFEHSSVESWALAAQEIKPKPQEPAPAVQPAPSIPQAAPQEPPAMPNLSFTSFDAWLAPGYSSTSTAEPLRLGPSGPETAPPDASAGQSADFLGDSIVITTMGGSVDADAAKKRFQEWRASSRGGQQSPEKS